MRHLYAKALEAGCTAEVTNGCHVKLSLPNGGVVFGPLTSSDRRAVLNQRAIIRRMGVAL